MKSSIKYYSCTSPATMPISHTPFYTPVDLNPSTDPTASSLMSSHQTRGESSAVNFSSYSCSSLLPTSKDGNPISTPDSNLTYDMRGIMNGKPPELLYLPSDFLPTKKKTNWWKTWQKIGPMQFTLTEAFQRKIQMTLRWNHSWKGSTCFMKKSIIIWSNVFCRISW